jgi:hypothetical protein
MAKEDGRSSHGADPLAVDTAVSRARAALVGLGGFESSEVIRAQRDERASWICSSELRSIVRDAPVDTALLSDLADVRGADFDTCLFDE